MEELAAEQNNPVTYFAEDSYTVFEEEKEVVKKRRALTIADVCRLRSDENKPSFL